MKPKYILAVKFLALDIVLAFVIVLAHVSLEMGYTPNPLGVALYIGGICMGIGLAGGLAPYPTANHTKDNP